MKLPLFFALLAVLLNHPAVAAENAANPNLDESRKTAQELMQKINDALEQKLAAGGPSAAMEVCKKLAPELESSYSKDGLTVRRVTLKPRNKARMADDWEARMLERADYELRAGKMPSTLEFSEVRDEAGGRWLRYFKAIPVQPMCLQCHGQPYQIPDDIKARLSADYPDDQAKGYSAGAIIGGVSIKRKLN